jgi:pepF/M3 family oligoendopeptidase
MMENSLPRWELSGIFPSLESAEFGNELEAVTKEIASLSELFTRHDVRRREDAAVNPDFVRAFDLVTGRMNSLFDRLRTLSSYIGCFVTTDANSDLARALESELDNRSVLLDQLHTRYVAWVGTSDVDSLLAESGTARSHEYVLRRAQIQAAHQMTECEEALAAELRPVGLNAWSLLHGSMTALLTARVQIQGKVEELPMSAVRGLASHPDRETRRNAYQAELKAWESVALPLSSALNSIKGFQRTVRNRRGWPDDIEPTLLSNSIDRQTLHAMQAACVESFPDFRRYLEAKARALGLERLAWHDVTAPVGAGEKRWTWPEAEEFVVVNFRSYSDRLADLASRAFHERWIDAGPRVGKEGGAYCTGLRPGESRIMMNYDFSFEDVSTLAHELGHAYHNLNLKDRTAMQRGTPSTLAETASIFCETIAFEAASKNAASAEKLALLDSSLQRDLLVVVDIHSRFLFEKGVFERRQRRDLTVPELNELMLECQRATYGPSVEPLHPYMWAVKGHYYGPTFYNYPYTFGLLFGLGIYESYRKDPEKFKARYDEFLSSTGLADAAALGRRFDAVVTEIDFWRSSLNVVRDHIREFELLVDSELGGTA